MSVFAVIKHRNPFHLMFSLIFSKNYTFSEVVACLHKSLFPVCVHKPNSLTNSSFAYFFEGKIERDTMPHSLTRPLRSYEWKKMRNTMPLITIKLEISLWGRNGCLACFVKPRELLLFFLCSSKARPNSLHWTENTTD